METDITFHATERAAGVQAKIMHKKGFKVALAGPCTPTGLNNDGALPTGTVEEERWIVVATKSGLIITA